MDIVSLLLPAFVLCVLLLAMHAYLGLHVLSRGIIFVDLALAQVAALGVSLAFLFGGEAHGWESKLYALAATLIVALGLARLRGLGDKTAREVAIGCVYVVATALSVVVLSRSTQGMEELKSLFNGNILWVSWDEIMLIAVIYAGVALLHRVFREKFFALTFADKKISGAYGWEFLFFAGFALVITFAVSTAGILLVFAFLIIPAFSASLIVRGFFQQWLLAWLGGIAACLLGLYVAYLYDLPVGATVVSVFGLLPVIAGLIAWRTR